MQGMLFQQSASSQEEWSLFLKAARQVEKDIAAHHRRLNSDAIDVFKLDFNFTHSAPQFHYLDDANECIQRLWSICSQLANKQQWIKEWAEKNSDNSSRPPSSDSIAHKINRYQANQRHYVPSGKKQGAQMGHVGVGRHLKPTHEVNKVIFCPAPDHCLHCGAVLVEQKVSRRKQVFYLKEKRLTITEFQILQSRCKECRLVFRGELPPGTPAGSFGSCVLSIITTLTGRYRLSKRQVKSCLYDLFGLQLSIGTISNAEPQISESLVNIAIEVHEAMKLSDINHADETTRYHQHQLRWMWLLSNEQLACLNIYRYRSKMVAQSLLGNLSHQTWVTDRFGVYSFLPKKRHQYCWAHLKRDIKAIMDHPDKQHAKIGNRLDNLRRTIFSNYQLGQVYPAKRDSLKMRRYLKEFRSVLREGRALRGKKTPSFCHNLIKNWRKLWNFLINPNIPSTNNHAEQMLRHNVIWRKLSLGTQSDRGDRYVERISTVQLSCRLQGRHLLTFLEEALNAYWLGHDPPSLLPGF